MNETPATPKSISTLFNNSWSITNAHILFWLGMPLIWTLPNVYYNINIGDGDLRIEFFTLLHIYIIWICCYLATRLVSFVTRSRPIKPIFVFFLGALIGILIFARPLLRASVTMRAQWFAETEELARQILDATPSYFEFSSEFVFALLSIYWMRIFCWTASAWFFFSFFGKPSFGIDLSQFEPLDRPVECGQVSQASSSHPQFLTKVNPSIGKDLVALKAEGHYVRVYTRSGNDLIYYRFSDAVSQLSDQKGIQVHRSYWVNSHEAEVVKDSRGKYELHLSNDLKVPIGQTYKHNARAAGLLT